MENKNEAYAEVIDVLMSGKVDLKAIAVSLAKFAPEVFLGLHQGTIGLSKEETDKREILAFMRANPGRKVEAIKMTRTLNGMGLKEAKDYVEFLEPLVPYGFDDPPTVREGLNEELAKLFPTAPLLRKSGNPAYADEGDF